MQQAAPSLLLLPPLQLQQLPLLPIHGLCILSVLRRHDSQKQIPPGCHRQRPCHRPPSAAAADRPHARHKGAAGAKDRPGLAPHRLGGPHVRVHLLLLLLLLLCLTGGSLRVAHSRGGRGIIRRMQGQWAVVGGRVRSGLAVPAHPRSKQQPVYLAAASCLGSTAQCLMSGGGCCSSGAAAFWAKPTSALPPPWQRAGLWQQRLVAESAGAGPRCGSRNRSERHGGKAKGLRVEERLMWIADYASRWFRDCPTPQDLRKPYTARDLMMSESSSAAWAAVSDHHRGSGAAGPPGAAALFHPMAVKFTNGECSTGTQL